MELRKVVSFGNSSFVVSLPRAWVKKNRLKKGDFLSVEELPAELVISAKDTDERRVLKEIIIDARNKPLAELKTEIISSYINNNDIVIVRGFSDLKEIKNIFHDLIGMEIIEETADKIVVKDLLDITEVSIANIVRRTDLLIKSMLEDLSIEEDHYESLFERDKEVNRLALLGFRLARAVVENPRLLRAFKTTNWDITISRQVIIQLERFADQIKRIGRTLRKVKDNNKKKYFQRTYSLVKNRYSEAMKIYYSKNKQLAFKMENETKSIMKRCDDFSEKCKDLNCTRLSEYLKHMNFAVTSVLRATMELN
jgi:phosphate uptake regulator